MIKNHFGSAHLVRVCMLWMMATLALAQSRAPMVLTGTVPLPGVHGRIDHLALDSEGRLFVSARGNNSVEIIDLAKGTAVKSIPGIPSPQGIVYSPETNKLFVASSGGGLYIYECKKFKLLGIVDFHGDVDNLRYDPASEFVYVGFGDGETAAVGAIDAASGERKQDFKVGAHPESFQLARKGANIYVNLPELRQVAVVDRKTWTVTRWPLPADGNFPMALDEADHRLFVHTRAPGKLLVLDTASGKTIASLSGVEDCDDLFYDAARKRIYASGGQGQVAVFQQNDADHYQLVARVPTAPGARTSGYFGETGEQTAARLFVAVPASADHPAEIRTYRLQD